MIFIVQDPEILAWGFRAVEGIKPIKLPGSVGVMDLYTAGNFVSDDSYIDEPNEVTDATSFSIIFSPSGKLVIHDVRVRNRDGKTEGTETLNKSKDDIFNTLTKITNSVNPSLNFTLTKSLIRP